VTLTTFVQIGLRISIPLTVVAVGLAAQPGDATMLFRQPGKLVRSLFAMMVIVPAFAVFAARGFELEAAVKIALGALSVSPVPPFWPNRVRKAGGDGSYIVGLLVATAVLSIIIIPLAMEGFEAIFSIPLAMQPLAIAKIAFATVLVPILVGLALARYASRFAARAARPVAQLATVLLVVSVTPVLFTHWSAITSLVGDGTLLTMLTFALAGLVAGHLLGGPAPEDRTVLAMACATRHPAIAISIAAANFPHEKLVPAAILLYVMVSAGATTLYVMWTRRHLRHGHRPLMAVR
jgi:BASS family bile acid:Na+ symporter